MSTRVTLIVAFVVLGAVALEFRKDASGRARPALPDAAATNRAPQAPHDIDSLMAPIALYPDQLLAQILLCAGDPATVTKLNGWLRANQKVKGSDLQDAAVLAGFEPSFVALALFPTVISSMAA